MPILLALLKMYTPGSFVTVNEVTHGYGIGYKLRALPKRRGDLYNTRCPASLAEALHLACKEGYREGRDLSENRERPWNIKPFNQKKIILKCLT